MPSGLSGCLLYSFSHCSLACKQAQTVASVLLINGVFVRSLCLFPIHISVPNPGSYHALQEVFKFIYHSHNVKHTHPHLAEPEARLIWTLGLKRSAFSSYPNLFPRLLHYEGGFAITIVNCTVMPQGSKSSLSLCQTERAILNVS